MWMTRFTKEDDWVGWSSQEMERHRIGGYITSLLGGPSDVRFVQVVIGEKDKVTL
jgi:hypothetical protein